MGGLEVEPRSLLLTRLAVEELEGWHVKWKAGLREMEGKCPFDAGLGC